MLLQSTNRKFERVGVALSTGCAIYHSIFPTDTLSMIAAVGWVYRYTLTIIPWYSKKSLSVRGSVSTSISFLAFLTSLVVVFISSITLFTPPDDAVIEKDILDLLRESHYVTRIINAILSIFTGLWTLLFNTTYSDGE